jgi:thioredoxin-like negative regulator of GroEL
VVSTTECAARVDALVCEGCKQLRHHEPQRALLLIEQALELAPNDLNARSALALCFLQLGRLEDAFVLYQAVEAELPESVHAKVNLALVLIKLGKAATARPILERALEIAPGHRRAWGYLGIALEQLGHFEEAERALLAGHYSTAASRLRERHATTERGAVLEFSAESTLTAMPAARYRQRTLPPDARAPLIDRPATPTVGISQLRRFNTTLRPPEFVAEQPVRITVAPPKMTMHPPEPVEEIPSEMAVTPASKPGGGNDGTPKPTRKILPLLDAALASLLLPPSEASVGVHATGLVVVSLVENAAPEGGFAARLDCVQAAVGTLARTAIPRQDPRRDPLAAQPFSSGGSPFGRFVGNGQLVLRQRGGNHLLPLAMDADVAFLREELVVAFDHALLYELGRVRLADDQVLSLVRFRGDGVVVLELSQSFLAFDVHGDQRVTLRSETLVGWLGLLSPEPAEPWYPGAPAPEFVTFSGEGTVLFTSPPDT